MASLQYEAPAEVKAAGKHTATVFMMHGLGDSAQGWLPVGLQLKSQLPHVKWIFPNAPTVRFHPTARQTCLFGEPAPCERSRSQGTSAHHLVTLRAAAEAHLGQHGHAHAGLVRHLRAGAGQHGSQGGLGRRPREWPVRPSCIARRCQLLAAILLARAHGADPSLDVALGMCAVCLHRAGLHVQLPAEMRTHRTCARACRYMKELIEKEIAAGTPAERIVVGGFSQGGAIALYSLRYPLKLAGVVGVPRRSAFACVRGACLL